MSAHVGMISQWYDPERGSAAQAGVIARSLIERGHRVEVVTGHPNYPTGKLYDGYSLRLYQHEVRGPVHVHRALLYPSHDASSIKRSLNYLSFGVSAIGVAFYALRDVDVCLVYASPATTAIPAMVLKLLRRTPYVVHIHDLWPDSVVESGFLGGWISGLVSRILHTFCDAMYKGASAVAVTSPGMARKIAARGVPQAKIHFVPNWADEDIFRPTPPDPELAAELGVGGGTTVMYAGNLGEYQDLMTVMEAAALLRDRSDIAFVIVGDGVERARLEGFCREQGLANVSFVGTRPFEEMPALLALGDLQLVTLRDLEIFRTTLPSKLVATLASGRPVLGGLSGDAASLVEASGAGEVVHPGRPAEMASAVVRFAGMSEDERRRRGAAGRAYYTEHLNRDTVGGRLSLLLEQSARSSAGSPS